MGREENYVWCSGLIANRADLIRRHNCQKTISDKELLLLYQQYGPYLAQLTEGVRSLSHTLQLDLLVIDSPAGISESNLSLLALADAALIVLHPTAPDFQGTAVLVDVARRLEVPQIQLAVTAWPRHTRWMW